MSEPTAEEWAIIEDKALDAQIEAYYEAIYQEREFGPQPDDPPPDDDGNLLDDIGDALSDWFDTLTPAQQDEVLDQFAEHLEGEIREKVLRRHKLIEAPPEPLPTIPHPRLETRDE